MYLIKGLFHEINSFLKAYNNKKVLSVHALIVFTILCFLVDETIKLKVLACFFEITGTYKFFENPSSNPL
jgi:hypothetical protein